MESFCDKTDGETSEFRLNESQNVYRDGEIIFD